MSEIYVTGHRNPDTDSIVASLAYANLRNALGDREYRAVRIGAINDETQKLLDRFGFEAPEFIKNMRTQVRDLDFDHPPVFGASVTLDLAWHAMRDGQTTAVPIVDEDERLYGMLSAGDIASYDIETIQNDRIEDLPIFNLLSVLEGTLVNEYSTEVSAISGKLGIALPQDIDDSVLLGGDRILISGDQPELIERAIRNGVQCVIICRSDVLPAWQNASGSTVIISTPLSPRRVSRLIYQAIPVRRVCQREGLVAFHLDDYVDDVQETMLKSRYRSYPVLDENDRVVGTLSRFHLLRPRRKRVVLVDHNEAAQSVPGLEQVEILEIIDHHRLADIQTKQPIRVRNEPVGSTNTILTAMYQEHGLVPSPKMAGLMAGAILSDTVLFKSPTCTKRDIAMAERLARIANISLDELGRSLFSAGGQDKSAEDLFNTDCKQFHIIGQNIAVSQITCDDSEALLERSGEFSELMRRMKQDKGFDMVLLMITDVLKEGTWLLYVGSDEVIRQAFSAEPEDGRLFLPGVMSRKKQVIPMLTALWG